MNEHTARAPVAGTTTSQTEPELNLRIESLDQARRQVRDIHREFQEMEGRLGDIRQECAGILDNLVHSDREQTVALALLNIEGLENRFRQLTDDCAAFIGRLAKAEQEHAALLSDVSNQLHDWTAIEQRLLEDLGRRAQMVERRLRDESAERLHQFERGVEQEWLVLRRLHEEPLKSLEEETSKLREVHAQAEHVAKNGLQIVESQIGEHTASVERRLNELLQQMQTALGDMRASQQAQIAYVEAVLENKTAEFTRLYDDQSARITDYVSAEAVRFDEAVARLSTKIPEQFDELRLGLTDRIDGLNGELTERQEILNNRVWDRRMKWLGATAAALLLLAVGLGVYAWRLGGRFGSVEAALRQTTERLTTTEARLSEAQRAADQALTAQRSGQNGDRQRATSGPDSQRTPVGEPRQQPTQPAPAVTPKSESAPAARPINQPPDPPAANRPELREPPPPSSSAAQLLLRPPVGATTPARPPPTQSPPPQPVPPPQSTSPLRLSDQTPASAQQGVPSGLGRSSTVGESPPPPVPEPLPVAPPPATVSTGLTPPSAPSTPQPQTPAPVKVGGNVQPPEKIRDVPPVYPTLARSARIQGIVEIEATIGPDGKVTAARIVRGIPSLNEAALSAVRQWEYRPPLLNGVAVSMVTTVRVTFRL